jgi:hydrogenase maturation protease
MSKREALILVIGFGNPGRHDDGLGPVFAERVEKLGLEHVTVEAGCQLTVEDAATISKHDVVVFADATTDGPGPFTFCRVQPDPTLRLGSHVIEPAAVLAMARRISGKETDGYLLGIRGYVLDELGEGLSLLAQSNLEMALQYLLPVLRRSPLRKEPMAATRYRWHAPSLAEKSCYA